MTDPYTRHTEVLWNRLRAHLGQQRADEANARAPRRRVVPMTAEARADGYLMTPGRELAAWPTPRQLRRLMRASGERQPGAVMALWRARRRVLTAQRGQAA
jgi:hypothetical protein